MYRHSTPGHWKLVLAYMSVRGAMMKVPMPEPQMAMPVTKGLFLSKYCVIQSSLAAEQTCM